MAPTKRSATSQPTAAAKKAKWGNIATAISKANISEEAKKLFYDVLPLSLGEFVDKRHQFQEQVVDVIEGVLKEIEVGLVEEVKGKQSGYDEAEKKKAPVDSNVAAATAALEASKTRLQDFKKGLATEAIAFRNAKQALEDSEMEQAKDAVEARQAQGKKAEFGIMLEHLEFLKEASPDDSEAQGKLATLLSMVKKHGFEDSMLIALPSALKKQKEARGQFDNLTISGLQAELAKRINEQDAIITNHAPTEAKHVAAIEKAKQFLNAVSAKLRASAKTYEGADAENGECTSAEYEAKKAVRDLANSSKKLLRALQTAEAELQVFHSGPLETFQSLRQQLEPKPEPEAEKPVPEELPEPVAAC